MRQFRGFTLVELMIVVALVGILAVVLTPLIDAATQMSIRTKEERQRMLNQQIGQGILSYADTQTPFGQLPVPYTSGSYKSAPVDPSITTLVQEITQAGVGLNELDDDGTSGQNVRVYQKYDTTIQVPLYGASGPLMNLPYNVGVVYSTYCNISDGTCNSTTPPSVSATLGSSNYTTWAVTAPDFGPYMISSLPLQKQRMGATVQRLEKVRDVMLAYFRTQQLGATAGDTTNWYPAGASSLSGQNPATNQGCYDGWYSLNTDATILNTVGLSPIEFGQTAWGGAVQYCRDYDPTASGANKAPHYAALRINMTPINAARTAALAPDNAVAGNNIFITF